MWPLIRALGEGFRAVAVDLPGFGAAAKPPVDWSAEAYRAFIVHLLREVAPNAAVVAAGHAATFALQAAHDAPDLVDRLVMVAPTWRGPLPTVFGSRPGLYRALRHFGDLPVFGHALYRANVNGPMLRMMSTEHVYSDRRWLVGPRRTEKQAVIAAEGARHASIRFVTGGLDPVASRDAWLGRLASAPCPVLIVYGEETPRRTRAEIDAAVALPNVQTAVLPRGKLGVHEEFPAETAAAVRPFLDESSER